MNIFPGDPNVYKDLKGEVLGVGAEGTTYLISGSISSVPVTGMDTILYNPKNKSSKGTKSFS